MIFDTRYGSVDLTLKSNSNFCIDRHIGYKNDTAKRIEKDLAGYRAERVIDGYTTQLSYTINNREYSGLYIEVTISADRPGEVLDFHVRPSYTGYGNNSYMKSAGDKVRATIEQTLKAFIFNNHHAIRAESIAKYKAAKVEDLETVIKNAKQALEALKQ